jgi:periplasmic divalent cation tolerance protein
MPQENQILVCLTTVADQQQAREIARTLLRRRAAACVQINGPIESHYWWDGKECCEQEYRLAIKTSTDCQKQVHQLLREIHPYEQPQIVTLQSSDVDPQYRAWVVDQTTP